MQNKNIWVLPTDKPSRLVGFESKTNIQGIDKSKTTYKLLGGVHSIEQIHQSGYTSNQIYITSDEEIKEGINVKDRWVISEYGFIVKADKIEKNYLIHSNGGSNYLHYYKFIILTTDKDLITDGVQSIPNDFLEWFVKNPTWYFVEIETIKSHSSCKKLLSSEELCQLVCDDCRYYKIVLPKTDDVNELLKNLPDFSHLSKEEKEKALLSFLEESGKYILAYFKMFGFKTHIECNIVNGKSQEKFKLIFRTQEYHLSQTRFSEEQVELICNEMVNWALDNVGNQNPESGKKFDEVISKYKV